MTPVKHRCSTGRLGMRAHATGTREISEGLRPAGLYSRFVASCDMYEILLGKGDRPGLHSLGSMYSVSRQMAS